MTKDIYANSCADADCQCRQAINWPDNIKDGCAHRTEVELKEKVICPDCHGNGYVRNEDGDAIDCITCDSYGELTEEEA